MPTIPVLPVEPELPEVPELDVPTLPPVEPDEAVPLVPVLLDDEAEDAVLAVLPVDADALVPLELLALEAELVLVEFEVPEVEELPVPDAPELPSVVDEAELPAEGSTRAEHAARANPSATEDQRTHGDMDETSDR